MCPTNSSTLICGFPTNVYLNSSDKSTKVKFHSTCKGRLFAAIVGSGLDQAILDVGNGHAPLTEDVDKFLQVCWKASHMNAGLWEFSATWLGLVVGLAEASVKFDTKDLSTEVSERWIYEPTEAYSWLKDRMREFQQRRPEISDIASDVPTCSEDMGVRQRARIDDKMDAINMASPSAIPPNLKLWHSRRATFTELKEIINRIDLIQFEVGNKEEGDPEIKVLNAEGVRLEAELDQVNDEYKAAGGHQEIV